MTERHWSSPFGARPLSAGLMAAQAELHRRQSEIAAARACGASNDDGHVADKWQLLRALSEGRGALNLTDRTICVLEALLSFHPGKAIDGARPIVVFPSNRELSLRSRGMAPATLRRHLAALVEAGLIVRRDSPNGKRFCRRGDEESGTQAFGFDLAPLALGAGRIFEAAETARQAARAMALLRQTISLHRRDIRKVLEAAAIEARPGAWAAFLARLMGVEADISRRSPAELLEAASRDLLALRAEVESAYLSSLSEEEMSANDADDERHYQNSKPEFQSELNGQRVRKPAKLNGEAEMQGGGEAKGDGAGGAPAFERGMAMADVASAGPGRFAGKASEPCDLAVVLSLCPEISNYARDPIRDWGGLVAVAGLVRGFLGISPDAWRQACEAMGEGSAAVVVAALLERVDRIRSPGGYLRNLSAKAARGRFDVGPMLAALRDGPTRH